jgi:hypothetical protein
MHAIGRQKIMIPLTDTHFKRPSIRDEGVVLITVQDGCTVDQIITSTCVREIQLTCTCLSLDIGALINSVIYKLAPSRPWHILQYENYGRGGGPSKSRWRSPCKLLVGKQNLKDYICKPVSTFE